MPTKNIDVKIANIQWWTIVGSVLFSTGLILLFLSFAALEIIPAIPYANVGSTFLLLSGKTFIVGVIGACIGLVILLYSKFRISKLALENKN
jgi:hypothetical protein